MGIGEGAEKSVGAAHVCVGNHDNPASSNYQASSHWNLYFFPWKGGEWKIKWKVLQKDGRDGTRHKKCKQPDLNVNDRSHMGNTLKQGSADNYKCPQTAHENLPGETTGQHCLVFNLV